MNEIWTIDKKDREKFLRERTVPFVFAEFTKKDVNDLVIKMRKMMKEANGIGLSANQIGLRYRVFVAQVPDSQGHIKFYAVFNPKIEKLSSEEVAYEEGCLSVPGVYGGVDRPARLTLTGFDKTGKPFKLKAWGLLARVIQHEVDHLEGKLFIDKAKSTYHEKPSERVRRQQEEEMKE